VSGSAASEVAPFSRWLTVDRGGLWEIARVSAVVPDTPQTTTLRLHLAEAAAFLSGQYYLVRLAVESPPGVVEQAYSASSSPFPVSPEFEITVQEVPGGRASPHLVHDVCTGDQLHVCGPFGFLTWTEADASPPILIGAGSGMAPLISIVRYAAARRARTPMTVLCSSRDRSAVLFHEALQGLDRDQPWLSVVHTFTRSAHDPYARYHRRIDSSMIDEVTRATLDAGIGNSSFLVAGPTAMVASVRGALQTLGVPDHRVNSETHA
jgi:glycine betaine catabolism B